jgi:hypothetical protein
MTITFYIQLTRTNKRLKKFASATDLHNYIMANKSLANHAVIIFRNADTGHDTGRLTVKRYLELQSLENKLNEL